MRGVDRSKKERRSFVSLGSGCIVFSRGPRHCAEFGAEGGYLGLDVESPFGGPGRKMKNKRRSNSDRNKQVPYDGEVTAHALAKVGGGTGGGGRRGRGRGRDDGPAEGGVSSGCRRLWLRTSRSICRLSRPATLGTDEERREQPWKATLLNRRERKTKTKLWWCCQKEGGAWTRDPRQ